MKHRLFKKDAAILFASVAASFLFVVLITTASTTISTNVNTGGTLTVTGASTLNGNVTLGDAAADVILSTGGFQASSTALMGSAVTFYSSATISGANGLVLGSSATDITGSAGMIYYNSASKVIKMHDGTDWFTVGTSTSGLTLSGNRLQLASLNYYMTFGTTTQQGLSVLTLESTSTASIPLTIVGRLSQTAKLLQIMNSAGTNLFTVDNLGQASTTMLTTTGDLFVNGFATTTAASGNFATKGTLNVTGLSTLGMATSTGETINGLASTTQLVVGGNGSTMAGMIFGYCTIPATTIQASSTNSADCSGATGIRSGDRVIVQATSSFPANFVIQAASSTSAAGVINVRIRNHGDSTGTVDTGVNSFNFIGIR